eukprot:2964270-Pyramimonas_sp.AAC.1
MSPTPWAPLSTGSQTSTGKSGNDPGRVTRGRRGGSQAARTTDAGDRPVDPPGTNERRSRSR